MYHDDRTERNYTRDRRYERHERHERHDGGRYDNRRDRRPEHRGDSYRDDSYYRRPSYDNRGNSSYTPQKRENPPMTKEQLERRVYCHNLSYRSSWQDLKDYMRQAGDVEHVRIMEDTEGRSRGCAVVMFTTKEGARRAIKTLNDSQFAGRSIFVREDRAYSERKSPRDSHGHDSESNSSSQSESDGRRRSGHRHRRRGRSRDEEDDRSSPRGRRRHRSRSRSHSRSSRSEYRSRGDRRSAERDNRSASRGDDRASSRDDRDHERRSRDDRND